jgi:hypothetical protein
MVPMNDKPMINVITETTRSAVPGSVNKISAADINVIVVAMRNQARPASGFMRVHQMTGDITSPVRSLQRRHYVLAYLSDEHRAAGMERAACRHL